VLFVTPSGDYFADPGTFTLMGYLMLFHEIGLDYTWSPYASEGGNFGLFNSHELMKQLNAKIYAEAKRLGVKWILGGECGHMWRVVNQYMDTMNGPADFLEEPVSPITGTKFENAKSTKMVHIAEFTSDLIRNNKLKLDPSRNDRLRVTFHDSCNPSRAMGLLEEPRYVLRNVVNHFHEMPENTIREQIYGCAGGAGESVRRSFTDRGHPEVRACPWGPPSRGGRRYGLPQFGNRVRCARLASFSRPRLAVVASVVGRTGTVV
ncbi:MAG: (Fe-S)-binding protein, partial [Thermodesulfobacteriota bacterium]